MSCLGAIRPIVGVSIATSRLAHLTPHDFFGTGFTLHLLTAESWINYTRLETEPRKAGPI